ncbi:glycosyltransferase [Micromonospora sp. KC606]|nr:glycosyltransferase [Micromonospora sp. KC606]
MVHSSFAVAGGAELYLRDLSRSLIDRGHQVRVFSRPSANAEPDDQPIAPRLAARLGQGRPRVGKVLTHLGDLVDPTGLRAADLRSFGPDVVHVHNWQGIGVLPVARLARAYPTCHTVHDYAICDPNNALANRGGSPLAELALGVRSAWLVRRLRHLYLLWPAQRTRDIVHRHVPGASRLAGRVVPLAVPSRGRRVQWRPGDRRVFLFLGALSRHKGIDLLLDAWSDIAATTGATLLVAGEGPLRGRVEEAARTTPSVRYLGYLDGPGKEDAMQHAGWLLLPSQWAENFPISCVEALTAGRPVIASAVARPPMASDGSVLTFDDRTALAALLASAARLPEPEYAALASSAARDGRQLDWGRHVDAVLASYETIRSGASATYPLPHEVTSA